MDEFDGIPLYWVVWEVDRINLSHRSTMFHMHGASLQDLFYPLVLVSGDRRPLADPTPGVDKAVLAVLHMSDLVHVLKEHDFKDLFFFLHSLLGS
jgi:hypothetical protein